MNFASAADITSALTLVARAEKLLVVSDFDGTLAGLANDPYQVPVNQTSISALNGLNDLPRTDAVILSGRHREGLQRAAGDVGNLRLVGSHGADGIELTREQQQQLDRLTEQLEALAETALGAFVEYKPVHRVLHYRRVDPVLHEGLVERARALATEGIHLTHGKCIEEFSVLDVTKGTWITNAREEYEATAVVFFGDDVTDENGMRALGPNDLGIRVGEGDTLAHLRITDLEAVAEVLSELLQMRRTVLPA